MTIRASRAGATGAAAALVGGAGSALLLALSAAPAGALPTTWTVDTLTDGAANAGDCTPPTAGSCSLRDALAAATIDDVVVFAPSLFSGGPGTITLDPVQGQLSVNGTDVQGPGADLLTIDADGNDRVFFVCSDAGGTTFSGLTVTGGDAQEGTNGGGFLDDCHIRLRLERMVVTGNHATNIGGAIHSSNGLVEIVDSEISGNTADSSAGGFYAGGGLNLIDSVVSGNSVLTVGGGGGFRVGRDMLISSSTISDNRATSCGGALYFQANDSQALIIDSTFSGNVTTLCYGGAIDVDGNRNTVLIANSTFTGNSAPAGGAIHSDGDNDIEIVMTTITGNTATDTSGAYFSGGGLHLTNDTATVTLLGTILAGNSAPAGGAADLSAGTTSGPAPATTVAADSSMIGIGAAVAPNITVAGTGNIRSDAPMLGALGDNGGSTHTMLPLAGSPVLDAGPAAADIPDFPGDEFDQRGPGFLRIIGTTSDIGAIEVQPEPEPQPQPEPVVPAFTG